MRSVPKKTRTTSYWPFFPTLFGSPLDATAPVCCVSLDPDAAAPMPTTGPSTKSPKMEGSAAPDVGPGPGAMFEVVARGAGGAGVWTPGGNGA